MTVMTIFQAFLVTLFIVSCTRAPKEQSIKFPNCVTIQAIGNINQILQIDSIFSSIKAIPLETKNECLISSIIKILVYDNKAFIQDSANKLFVFNMDGRFLFEVGNMGRGPGEYLSLRDFDIDKDGNIYILDFGKILKYNNNGTFLKSFPYDFSPPSSEIICNPIEFAVKNDGNFYLWGGTFSIDSNPDNKFFACYEITQDAKIKSKYFPLRHYIPQGFQNHRFIHYKDIVLIDPIFGNNVIYSINNDGIQARYKIDFGKKTMNIPVPEGFTSLSEFKNNADQSYYHTIEGFNETDNWIYFRFFHKKNGYNAYFSKTLKKSFISKYYLPISGRLAPRFIFTSYNEDFVTKIDPEVVIQSINNCKKEDLIKLSISDRKIIEQLSIIKNTDNPILLICSLRRY